MTKPEKKTEKKLLRPGRDLIATKTESFRKRLIKAVELAKREVVLDFAKVEKVDSVGLGLIIAAHNTLKGRGGKLTLINVSKEMQGLFLATRLDRQFEVNVVE